MASFVIHYIAGEQLLKELMDKYGIILNEEERNKFLMGNLIVDSSRIKKVFPENISEDVKKLLVAKYRQLGQDEKISTHFRGTDDLDKCVQAPVISKFVNKYSSLFKEDISVLGYLFHLYTDKLFFDDLLRQSFEFLNDKGEETIYTKETKKIRTLKDNQIHDALEFWSKKNPNGIYTDYTIINKILLEAYSTKFNSKGLMESKDVFINPGIEEVDYSNISSIINKTSKYIAESYSLTNDELSVFDINVILNFIPYVVVNFINNYSDLIEVSCNKNNSRISKCKR